MNTELENEHIQVHKWFGRVVNLLLICFTGGVASVIVVGLFWLTLLSINQNRIAKRLDTGVGNVNKNLKSVDNNLKKVVEEMQKR